MTNQEKSNILNQIRENSKKIDEIQKTLDSYKREIEYWKSVLSNYYAEGKPERENYSSWHSFNEERITWQANISDARSNIQNSISDHQNTLTRKRSLIDANRILRDQLR